MFDNPDSSPDKQTSTETLAKNFNTLYKDFKQFQESVNSIAAQLKQQLEMGQGYTLEKLNIVNKMQNLIKKCIVYNKYLISYAEQNESKRDKDYDRNIDLPEKPREPKVCFELV